jgi:hypothetical protein
VVQLCKHSQNWPQYTVPIYRLDNSQSPITSSRNWRKSHINNEIMIKYNGILRGRTTVATENNMTLSKLFHVIAATSRSLLRHGSWWRDVTDWLRQFNSANIRHVVFRCHRGSAENKCLGANRARPLIGWLRADKKPSKKTSLYIRRPHAVFWVESVCYI